MKLIVAPRRERSAGHALGFQKPYASSCRRRLMKRQAMRAVSTFSATPEPVKTPEGAVPMRHLLAGRISADYIQAVPAINLTDDETHRGNGDRPAPHRG